MQSFQLLIAITLDDNVFSPCRQHSMIKNHQFKVTFDHSSLPDRARLLSVSSPDAAVWLSVLPSLTALYLHMDPLEFQVGSKWWLGMDLAQGFNCCTFRPSIAFNPMGHHAITCKHRGDEVSRHSKLHDVFVECFTQVEVGSGLGMTNATPDQQMFCSPTGLFGSQLHFILLLPHPG